MRIDRFFLPEEITEDTITISDERLLYQWQKVLRAKKGFKLVLFDGTGVEYEAEIQTLSSEQAELTITNTRVREPITPELWLYVGLIKKDKFEWIIEKATEIGVAGIVPLDADRSQKKNLSFPRAHKIIVEAAEQSGRSRLPTIGEVSSVQTVLEKDDVSNAVFLDKRGEGGVENILQRSDRLHIFIGPEGGWSEKEQALFQQANIQSITLGQQNLKTETAAISVSALTLLVS